MKLWNLEAGTDSKDTVLTDARNTNAFSISALDIPGVYTHHAMLPLCTVLADCHCFQDLADHYHCNPSHKPDCKKKTKLSHHSRSAAYLRLSIKH